MLTNTVTKFFKTKHHSPDTSSNNAPAGSAKKQKTTKAGHHCSLQPQAKQNIQSPHKAVDTVETIKVNNRKIEISRDKYQSAVLKMMNHYINFPKCKDRDNQAQQDEVRIIQTLACNLLSPTDKDNQKKITAMCDALRKSAKAQMPAYSSAVYKIVDLHHKLPDWGVRDGRARLHQMKKNEKTIHVLACKLLSPKDQEDKEKVTAMCVALQKSAEAQMNKFYLAVSKIVDLYHKLPERKDRDDQARLHQKRRNEKTIHKLACNFLSLKDQQNKEKVTAMCDALRKSAQAKMKALAAAKHKNI